MGKHTPGPWQVEARKGETWICRSDSAVLARLGAAKEMRANARLIAAAPDLLEALQEYVNHDLLTMTGGKMNAKARAAIAAATGEAA